MKLQKRKDPNLKELQKVIKGTISIMFENSPLNKVNSHNSSKFNPQ